MYCLSLFEMESNEHIELYLNIWRNEQDYHRIKGACTGGSPWVLDADGPGVLRVGGVEFDIPAELVRKILVVLECRCWWSRSSQGWRGGVWYPSWTGEEDAGSPWVVDSDVPGVLRVGGGGVRIPVSPWSLAGGLVITAVVQIGYSNVL